MLDPETGELVRLLTEDEARALTDRIRDAAEHLWSLLAEAHERQAWRALGYDRWEDYVRAEFNMTRQRAYQLLDQAKVIREIQAAASVSTSVDTAEPVPAVVTEAQARDVKPILGELTDSIRERLNEVPEPTPERVQRIVQETITEHRAKVQQRREDAAAMQEMRRLAEAAGIDQDEDRLAERGAFARLCRDLAALPDPRTFVARHGRWLDDDDHDRAHAAWLWLSDYLQETR